MTSPVKEGGLTSADKDLVTLKPTQIPISMQNFTGNPFLSVTKRFESILRFKFWERASIFFFKMGAREGEIQSLKLR